jgi:arginine/lysine/ornithine decarboxylase
MARIKRGEQNNNEAKEDMTKTKMEIENIDPNKKKTKKIKELVVAKEDKVKEEKPKEEKTKEKPKSKNNIKNMNDKELKTEVVKQMKELQKIKDLVNKINSIME